MKRKAHLTPVPFDDSVTRPPTPQRPVRSRARSLAMDAHIKPHHHACSAMATAAAMPMAKPSQVSASAPTPARTNTRPMAINPGRSQR